jgi:cyanophycinase
MGEFIYSAETGSVVSDEALRNPYHRFVDLTGPLFNVAFLGDVITDSHFYQVRVPLVHAQQPWPRARL